MCVCVLVCFCLMSIRQQTFGKFRTVDALPHLDDSRCNEQRQTLYIGIYKKLVSI